ncbi:MAG: MFS transporter [Candidatus Omnitrophota bacterium]
MFSSLRTRDFRIYLIGMFVSMCGTWIQAMVQNWLVYDLSKSSFMLGLVGFVTYSPIILLSLFSGVLVDRVNKRYLLVFAQIAFMLFAFALALLTQFNLITVNLILLISLMNGIVLSIDAPARQAMVFELVGKERILNAVALNSIAFHSARMIGPALAGIFVAIISIAGCFYINAVSFLAFIVALLWIRPKHAANHNPDNHFMQDLKGGINFIKANRIYIILISIVGAISLFGFSYSILLPVFAKNILGLEIKGYGLLMSASGVGSLLGGFMLASLNKSKSQIKILSFTLIVFAVSLILFSLTTSLVFSILILVLAGFSSLSSLAIINSLIQTMVPNEFRGRIMSIYMLVFIGTIPFGSLLAGSLAHSIGVSSTLLILGLICFVIFLYLSQRIIKSKLFS